MKKLVIAISGASATTLALKFLKEVQKTQHCYAILSESAKIVAFKERGEDLQKKIEDMGIKVYQESEIWAGIASGSFGVNAMAIIPTSMNTLAKIACGMSDDLISRCAAVMLKEKKTLLLAPREMPFSAIALENMSKLASLGVIIAPPVLGYYSEVKSLELMEDFLVGKWLDVLGIQNSLYQRWEDKK
ncbi:UbiX family flavin prenyltransferase [Helicobacter cholecystus]|uniref:UbiX family flavin prenyltransferase n=1 Tax=Helicobacter cholecystus TaxID=45498 RepID=A0A3D8IZL1_9HELI|nr:UbiX family flavin prenyltransferase [Helicobacter cholecystus]RDU70064.1 UbiX family flavin prenyltransferase [Helicobacter cholecystus]VEJ24765.1 3-octaprenyl-4-hydroxybenzoate carboxy-lyase [Helicobacter cholecystus]